MLRVSVTLQPWWGGQEDEKVIADMTIYNTGETTPDNKANYVCISHNMTDGKKAKRVGAVEDYQRNQDVWHLVAKALEDMGYGV